MSYIGSTPTSQAFAPGTDTFSGTGSQVAFTLSRNVATVNDILVVVNNVDQQPTAYSVASNVLTFTAAPSSGTNNIYVRYLSTNLQTIAPQQGSVYPSSLSTQNAVYWDTSGNVGVGTTSPIYKMNINNNGAQVLLNNSGGGQFTTIDYANSGTVKGNLYWDQTNTYFVFGTDVSAPVLFKTNAAERMRVDSAGNVGINNTSPSTYDTSGKILAISGTATNTNPSVILMEGTNAAPGRGSFVTETFAIAGISNTATEITRITGTGSNGMSMYIRVTYTGHTSAVGNGTNYKAVRYDGGTTAVTQVETATSGSVPVITFDTATSNVLIIKLNSSTAGQTTNGVMVVQWFIPIDFGNNTWTIS